MTNKTYNPLTHKIVPIEQRLVTQLSAVFVKEGSYSDSDYVHYVALCNDGTMWFREDAAQAWRKLQNVPQPEGVNSNIQLQAENDDRKRKIISLENELVEWNEFKKIRDAQMQALRKQMP